MNEPLLLVSAGGRRVAFRMIEVLEVRDGAASHRVPAVLQALRGVTPVRGRLVPLVHLGALLSETACPSVPAETVVVADTGGRPVAFEVDSADASPISEILPAPADSGLPWVRGVLRRADGWIPVLNLDVLAKRLRDDEVTPA